MSDRGMIFDIALKKLAQEAGRNAISLSPTLPLPPPRSPFPPFSLSLSTKVLNPKLYTLTGKPTPSTLNPQPSTLNCNAVNPCMQVATQQPNPAALNPNP